MANEKPRARPYRSRHLRWCRMDRYPGRTWLKNDIPDIVSLELELDRSALRNREGREKMTTEFRRLLTHVNYECKEKDDYRTHHDAMMLLIKSCGNGSFAAAKDVAARLDIPLDKARKVFTSVRAILKADDARKGKLRKRSTS